MQKSNLSFKYISDDSKLIEEFSDLNYASWPAIGLMDNIGWDRWFEMIDKHPEYHFGVYDHGELVAIGNCIPIFEEIDLDNLPNEGWRWAILQSLNAKKDAQPKYISALSATIHPEHRGKRLAEKILHQFKYIAKQKNCTHLLAPIRPTKKHLYPLVPMEDYIDWKREDGNPYDTWINIHTSIGGELKKVCKNAMIASWNLKKWQETYPDIYFGSTGDYIIPYALAPVFIDLEKQHGVYYEDGVWFVHEC